MNESKKKTPKVLTPTEAVLESTSDGVFTVDLEWRVTSFNRAAETITGVSRGEAIGRHCSDVFRSSMCGDACALQQTLKTGKLEAKYRVGDLTRRSPLMQRVFEVLPAIAESPSTVLILEETGTGKELAARTIHSLSPRIL